MTLESMAAASWPTVTLADQSNKADVYALAGGLVYARTGDTAYRTKVVAALQALQAWSGSVDSLAMMRQFGGWAMAADLVDYREASFVTYLSAMRTRAVNDPDGEGDHSRWPTIVRTHEDSSNNYGAFAGASRIAISAYLGDTADLARAAQVLQGFLGDRSAYASFRGQTGDNLYADEKTWACDASTSGFVPINDACSRSGIDLDGAIVSDIYRGGPLQLPALDPGVPYTLESFQGLIVQTELLSRNGYPGAWGWSNAALRRAAGFVTRQGQAGGSGWNYSSVNYHVPWLLNARYGLGLPTRAAGHGRMFGFTDWLYGS
jgi:hypothetical protein